MTADGRDRRLGAAVRNNAAWCDAMCRAHGIVGELTSQAWTSRTRTPPLYPDATTLDPRTDERTVLTGIDSSSGCSIKDSFATLDLEQFGFAVLFDATWIHGSFDESTGDNGDPRVTWSTVDSVPALSNWEQAWAGASEVTNLFVPALLDDPNISVISGAADGTVVAGGVLNRLDDVVGISNLFGADTVDPDAVWIALTRWSAEAFPGRCVVGYESGPELDAAVGVGFTPVGPLRVWLRPG